MRTVITGGGFLVVTALCVLIHCSIISTNMRDNEVSNSLDKASDYAVDVMGDIYLRLDYSQGNTAAYMQELIQGFCRAVNEKIGTDGELSVQVVKADIENGNFDIINVNEVSAGWSLFLDSETLFGMVLNGSCSYEKAFSFEPQ